MKAEKEKLMVSKPKKKKAKTIKINKPIRERKITSSKAISDNTIGYLQTEFNASVDLWKHIYDRLDGEVKYHFALIGALSAAFGLSIQIGYTSPFELIITMIVLDFIILVAGFRLLRRIAHLTYTMAELSTQIGLIRRCFINQDKLIEPYIILNIATSDKPAHEFPPVSKQLSVRLLSMINSIAAAVMIILIVLVVFIVSQSTVHYTMWSIVSAVVSVIVGWVFHFYQAKEVAHRYDEKMDQLSKTAQVRLDELSALTSSLATSYSQSMHPEWASAASGIPSAEAATIGRGV